MRMINKGQIIALQTALRTHGLTEQKKELVKEFTDGETDSVSRMTWQQAFTMLRRLNEVTNVQSPEDKIKELRKERMCKKIFAIAHDMGWIAKRQKVTEKGLEEVNDYSRVYGWISTYGYLHKNLRDYAYEELPKLVSQFEKVYFDTLKK